MTASGGMEASGRLRDLACSRPRAGPFKPGVSAVSLEEECERAGFKSLAAFNRNCGAAT